MNHKNIALTYAPGMAGNHVANLICLNNDFAQREDQQYEGSWHTHPMDPNNNLRNLTMFPNKRNVVLGHVDEMWHAGWDFQATDTQLVNVEHDGDEFFEQRTQAMFRAYDPESYARTFMHISHRKFYFYYHSDVIQKLLDAPSVLTLSTSQISKFESLYEFITDTLGVDIPLQPARDMHAKWLDNNLKWMQASE